MVAMQSTIQVPNSVSRKKEEQEEDLSADIPSQKRTSPQDTWPLEGPGIAVADPDQLQLTLSPLLEPPLRNVTQTLIEGTPGYETPSPETSPVTLPSISDAPARYKRRRDVSEFDSAAPSKRRNVAREAIQTPPMHVICLIARCLELIEDAMVYAESTRDAPDGGQTLTHSSSSPPTSAQLSFAPLSSASQFETSTICDDTSFYIPRRWGLGRTKLSRI